MHPTKIPHVGGVQGDPWGTIINTWSPFTNNGKSARSCGNNTGTNGSTSGLERLSGCNGPFPARVALFGDSNFSAWLFLVTNVTIFSKSLIFHISELVAPGEV